MYKPDDEQLRKYFQGELDRQESRPIKRELDTNPAARQYFEQMKKIWEHSKSINEFEATDTESGWTDWKKKITISDQEVEIHSRPMTNYAFKFLRTAAAILLVGLAASLIYYYTGIGRMNRVEWITYESGETQDRLELPDGSAVFLNYGSSLQYPEEFKGKKRLVILEGEGFFEVERNEKKSFIIDAGDEAVAEVLGTSFNLRTDPESKKVYLSVLSGKVAFYQKGKEKEAKTFGLDEHAIYDNGGVSQSLDLDLNFLSWRTQTLEFESTPLTEVVEQLGRHYRKDIMIVGRGLDTLALTGIYKNQSLADVLEEIEIVLEIKFDDVAGEIHALQQ